MPILYEIDRQRRLVTASPHGRVSDAEMFKYQREVWSRPDVQGFDELIDLGKVTEIEFISASRVMDLAELAGQMDTSGLHSRLAIVAASDLFFGLARMYQSQREMATDGRKEVRVFRDRKAAEEWLSPTLADSGRMAA